MLLYCCSTRLVLAGTRRATQRRFPGPRLLPQPNMTTLASRAQARGFAGLSSLTTIRRTASLPSTSNPSSRSSSPYLSAPSPLSTSPTPALPSLIPTLSAEQLANQEAEDAARDLAAVKSEIYRWKQAPLRTMDEKFDLVHFWEVSPPTNHPSSN
jgi:hypothetical protein